MSEAMGSGIGAVRARRQSHDAPATVIVSGLRGRGSALVSAALRDLGVPIFSESQPEGVSKLLGDQGRTNELQTLIEENDTLESTWGFEIRETFRLLPSMLHLFRNPHVIAVFEDPVAIAGPEPLGEKRLLDGLATASADILALVEMMRALASAALVVSYERARADPRALVAALVAYCGISPREGQLLRATVSIESGHSVQLPAPQLWYEGRLESTDKGLARGWARRIPANEPCLVEIVSDGIVIGRGLSDRAFESKDEALRQRGFEIELPASHSHALSARVAGTGVVLADSAFPGAATSASVKSGARTTQRKPSKRDSTKARAKMPQTSPADGAGDHTRSSLA